MKELMRIETMSSLQIAELTGKQHAHVMRDIRNLLEQGVSESNFGLSSYKQEQPNGGFKEVSCYNLTKKGCLILASGYNAKLREAIINRWEELELANHPKVPTTFREALLLAAEQQAQIEEQQKMISEQSEIIVGQNEAIQQMKPKVSYYDIILQSKDTMTVKQIAVDYGMTANNLNDILRKNKVQYKVNDQWILYAQYAPCGYIKTSTGLKKNSKHNGTYNHSRWTQKGRLFLYAFLKELNILPLIEQ